jgi:hypothetical protein
LLFSDRLPARKPEAEKTRKLIFLICPIGQLGSYLPIFYLYYSLNTYIPRDNQGGLFLTKLVIPGDFLFSHLRPDQKRRVKKWKTKPINQISKSQFFIL